MGELSGALVSERSGFVTDADRVELAALEELLRDDPFLDVDTGEVRSRVRSTRSALCEVPLLAAEVCVAEASRPGVPLRRDVDAVKLPTSDLSGENRETKIGMSLPYQTFIGSLRLLNDSEGRGAVLAPLTSMTVEYGLKSSARFPANRP